MKKQTTMGHPHAPLILIIDDEEAILKTLKDALTDESYRVETLSDGRKALDLIGKLIPDLILLDIFMPNCNGLKLLGQIKKEYPDQNVIIISGFGNIPIAIEAIQKSGVDFIEKPLNLDEILSKINFVKPKTEKSSDKVDPQDYNTQAESFRTQKVLLKKCNIIGESNLFLELMQQAEKLAPYNFPILIYGEYGTGKTALARYMHHIFSPDSTFTTIDCETNKITDDTFDTITDGTLYLKNIDHLDQESQKTLLLWIEQKGGMIPPTDNSIRIIASSRAPLFSMIQNKTFNESLFYHLNKAPLEVPPLRKRPYDIPLLVNHFLQKSNAAHNKKIVFNTQSIRIMRNYNWPGNISALEQAIEKIVICSNDDYEVASISNLASVLGEKAVQFIEDQSISYFSSLEEATDEFKRNFLLYLLKKNNYNINQVSHRLNLSPLQLKNKLLELNIVN